MPMAGMPLLDVWLPCIYYISKPGLEYLWYLKAKYKSKRPHLQARVEMSDAMVSIQAPVSARKDIEALAGCEGLLG
jgi:hypothetical protein